MLRCLCYVISASFLRELFVYSVFALHLHCFYMGSVWILCCFVAALLLLLSCMHYNCAVLLDYCNLTRFLGLQPYTFFGFRSFGRFRFAKYRGSELIVKALRQRGEFNDAVGVNGISALMCNLGFKNEDMKKSLGAGGAATALVQVGVWGGGRDDS